MLTAPRSLVVPVVTAVEAVAVLAAVYDLVFASEFCSFYDAYIVGSGAASVPAFVFYRRFYGIGPVIAAAALGFGLWLVFRVRVPAAQLAWYTSVSGALVFAWFLFTLAVERILFFQYAIPA